MKINKVLVAGGAGFIGSHLVDYYLKNKREVIVLDNFSSGIRENLPESNKDLTIIECDISKSTPTISSKIEYIFHLASPACPSLFKENPQAVLDANDLGTRHLLQIARKKKSRFIFTSTSEIYGMPEISTNTSENSMAHLHSLTSRSCYASSKRFAEELAMVWKKEYKLDTRIIRIFNVYGTKMDRKPSIYGRVIPNFIRAALNNSYINIHGDGQQVRSFCWVSDIIEGLDKVACVEDFPVKALNLGRSEPIKIIDLAKLIIKLTDSKSKLKYAERDIDDAIWRCPDTSLAEKILNWKSKVSIEEGLKKLLKYEEIRKSSSQRNFG